MAILVSLALGRLLAASISDWDQLVADDAYITYIYGRNVTEGHGLRYDAADAETTAGASNPMHTCLSAVFHQTGLGP